MSISPERKKVLITWLKTNLAEKFESIGSITKGASSREYFRVFLTNKSSLVAVSEPEVENGQKFLEIAEILDKFGLQVPKIYAKDLNVGFLLVSDFGDRIFLNELNLDSQKLLYKKAIAELVELNKISTKNCPNVPTYDKNALIRGMNLFKNIFLVNFLKLEINKSTDLMLQKSFEWIAEIMLSAQPFVLLHRDFHSENLMILNDESIGILDFQDAIFGPSAYDIVSLLRDCYYELNDEAVEELLHFFYEKMNLNIEFDDFKFSFDICGLQRHLRVLAIFSRKAMTDNDPRFIQFFPRIMQYIKYELNSSLKLAEFRDYFENTVLPVFQEKHWSSTALSVVNNLDCMFNV